MAEANEGTRPPPEAAQLQALIDQTTVHAIYKIELKETAEYARQQLIGNVPIRLVTHDLARIHRAHLERKDTTYKTTDEMVALEEEYERVASLLDPETGSPSLHGPRATPPYWATQQATKDKFTLVKIGKKEDPALFGVLAEFMTNTNTEHLGQGRDVGARWRDRKYRLELAAAWRIEHHILLDLYAAGKRRVGFDMTTLAEPQNVQDLWGKCSRGLGKLQTRATARKLYNGPLDASVNEQVLLHGTKPSVLLEILNNGLNERYSSGLFGSCTYFAEDAGKNDQYVQEDTDYEKDGEICSLHKRLYPDPREHPGFVYYIIVCRVCLGFPVRTQDGIVSMDDGSVVFPKHGHQRELSSVAHVTPPVTYHSLIAETGEKVKRFREFILPHGEFIYPEYLLAYHRKPRS